MSEHTLNPPSIKRLERSRTDKVLAGVSSGLGRYFDLTPAVFRLGFVVLTLLGGAGILVYIAAVLVMPKEGDDRSIAEGILAERRDHPARLIALGLVAVALLSLLARADTWPTAGTAWVLVAIAGLIFLWTAKGRGARGALVAVVSILVLIFVIAVTAVTAAFAWFDVSLHDGVGTRTYAPVTVQRDYHLGIGRLDLDLTRVPAGSNANVSARVDIGELRITIPRDARVAITAHAKVGSVDVLGRHDDGTDVTVDTGRGATNVHAHVGAGHIEIDRAP